MSKDIPSLPRRLGRAYWRLSIAISLVLTAVLSLVLIVGVVMIVVSLPDRSTEGAITKAGDIALGGLRPGDCFDLKDAPDAQVVYLVRAVPCAESHRLEVLAVSTGHRNGFASPTMEGDAYLAHDCVVAFGPYVGVAPEGSALETRWLRSTDSSFETEDGVFLCAIFDPRQERLTGSLRGSAQ